MSRQRQRRSKTRSQSLTVAPAALPPIAETTATAATSAADVATPVASAPDISHDTRSDAPSPPGTPRDSKASTHFTGPKFPQHSNLMVEEVRRLFNEVTIETFTDTCLPGGHDLNPAALEAIGDLSDLQKLSEKQMYSVLVRRTMFRS